MFNLANFFHVVICRAIILFKQNIEKKKFKIVQ